MRLGVLDVGSNTVHLLVVDARRGAPPVPQSSRKSVLRLMRYLDQDGALSDEGVDAVVEAVSAAAEHAAASDLDELLPFATSALREAPNGPQVLDLVARRTGVRLQVLSGEEEARLTFLAVRRWYGWSAGSVLLMDIGGGSLEIASGGAEEPDAAVSLPLGAGRSTVSHLHDDPPTEGQVQALREYAGGLLDRTARRWPTDLDPAHVVGSSKTVRSLARLAGGRVDGVGADDRRVLRRADLEDWVPRLARMPAEARPALPGITADRTFQVVAGGVVLAEAMRAFGVTELDVSPWALREGLILRYLDRLA
ncbi:Ppx/GppA phosphatase family protein [Cellulomonas bogoriensis]|uniref:Exopolyphosphatase n=1 Tax=Cellulomonas bogoriensis 69B4 = DSM 16987 TaxID=1386082 RepID=A0A0A0BYI6_9CELL|nr:Ppx/GppA phosphatase family protein [Cellulomonas bogoriensis]KGM13468.1 exopolyphosphatase [Cellulomonas bogoriensis 69B4 = DSM 16987]